MSLLNREYSNINDFEKHLKEFENKLIKLGVSKLELFNYVGYYSKVLRLYFFIDNLSSWNKAHEKIRIKMDESFEAFIERNAKHFNLKHKK